MRLQLFNVFLFPFYGEVHCLNSYAQGSFHTETPAFTDFLYRDLEVGVGDGII